MKVRSKIKVTVIAVMVLMLLAVSAYAGIPETPKSFDYVFDYAGILSETDMAEIREYGSALQEATGGKDGDQIIAVIVNFLDGIDSRDYAVDIVNTWGIGDDGAVILLAIGDRAVEISPGKGLDKLFSAKARGEILDDNIDYFANNQFADGMVVLYEAVCNRVATLRGKTLSVASQQQTGTGAVSAPVTTTAGEGGFGMGTFLMVIILLLVVLFIMGSGRRRRRARRTPPPPAQNLFGGFGGPGMNTRGNVPPRPARGGGYWGGNTRNAPPEPQRPAGRGGTPPGEQWHSAKAASKSFSPIPSVCVSGWPYCSHMAIMVEPSLKGDVSCTCPTNESTTSSPRTCRILT